MSDELTCSVPATSDADPTFLKLTIPPSVGGVFRRPITQSCITFKGNIDRQTTPGWRACLGFMTEAEARSLTLADAIKNQWVATEPPESSNQTKFEMSEIPATGIGVNELKGWRVKMQHDQLIDFKGPFHLGNYNLYLPLTDGQLTGLEDEDAIIIESRNLRGLGGIAEPAAPASPLRRYSVLPSVVMPTAWMLDKAVFLGDVGTLRVFTVVVRWGSSVPQEPVGIPYVVEAAKDAGSSKWIARNIHTAIIEPPSAIQCENELIMWEYRGGSKWNLYRQPFFAQKAFPS